MSLGSFSCAASPAWSNSCDTIERLSCLLTAVKLKLQDEIIDQSGLIRKRTGREALMLRLFRVPPQGKDKKVAGKLISHSSNFTNQQARNKRKNLN